MKRSLVVVAMVVAGCSGTQNNPQVTKDGASDKTPAATASASAASSDPMDGGAGEKASPPEKAAAKGSDLPSKPGKYDVSVASPPGELAEWLKKKVPAGGAVEAGDAPKVTHTVAAGENALSIATKYLPLSDLYTAGELMVAITKKNPAGVAVGKSIVIPNITTRIIHDDPKDERLGWPADKSLRGVFVTGSYASIRWVDLLDKVAVRDINAVVLDGKDYDGYVNYPSQAKIAVESGAIRANNIPDLARAIRFAHWRGVRVIVRIPCFHDPWADKHTKDGRLSIKFPATNKPIHVDWLDPTNTEAQDYAIELAKEGIEAGADEIQLDYVRFPVHLSHKVAVLPQKEERSGIIRDFVKRVRAVTAPAGVALSLDFFGVAATGEMSDIQYLGQHIPTVAPEADAISLMSYPSHYTAGWMGFKEPGEHPEIIAIGNKAALKQLEGTNVKTVFRTWLQAFPQRSPNYGSAYVAAEAKHAVDSGGIGWLMWSPACEYSAVWGAFPPKKK